MTRRITIDPITRLEGHGKIQILFDKNGDVERAYLQVPDFKGFEKFCEGRAVEEMPTLTEKICGVCPTAHHTASSKALDALFDVEPPPAAKKIRELMYNAFVFEDHLLHYFFLGGPDLLVGCTAPKAERNILGVVNRLGTEVAKKAIGVRKRVRNIVSLLGGSVLYPVCGLPGGVSKTVTEKDRAYIQNVARESVEFARIAMASFRDVALKNKAYVKLLKSKAFVQQIYSMGLVGERNRVNFYDGMIRVVDPEGQEFVRFEASDYLNHLAERVEPWTYQKTLYLKNVGWKGFVDGKDSGVYRVGPLGRLNAADGMATPLAHAAYEQMYDVLGGKPAHNTMAYHWARLVEVLYAAERMREIANDEALTDPKVRNIPTEDTGEGAGVCEAPRGTLYHHYQTDGHGFIKKANLLVATQNNAAAISMSVESAARTLLKAGQMSDGKLNVVEMAYRAYDPCLACATH